MSPNEDVGESPDGAAVLRDDLLALLREANERLVLSGILAHEAADLRERLIGILGHDLRGPLGTMVMSGEHMLERGELDPTDARMAKRVVSSGHRMARMITQILDFTRARLGGGFELRLAPSDLGAVCHDVAEELRIERSVEIQQTVAGDLAGTWDADRLAEVISNLAGNAVDHAAPGSTVVIDARAERGDVVAEVTNEGACIPAELIASLFEPFRRAEPDAAATNGHLGLGLYISCEIVRAHGGALRVRSSDGSTTFTMRLPRDRSLDPAGHAARGDRLP